MLWPSLSKYLLFRCFVEASSVIFRPLPPFSALSTIPANAIYFGSFLGFQRFCCKSLELVRRQEDWLNEIFGFGMLYPYYRYVLNHSEQRLVLHNRVVGGAVVLSVLYANLLAWQRRRLLTHVQTYLSRLSWSNSLRLVEKEAPVLSNHTLRAT